MGNISEMLDAIKSIAKGASDTADTVTSTASQIIRPKASSISSMAMQGVANFAVLVPDDLDIDDALMIGQSLEQRFATFLLTIFTMNPYMEVDPKFGVSSFSAANYLKQFHQNMGTQYELNPEITNKLFESGIPNEKLIQESVISYVTEAADKLGVDCGCWITEASNIVYSIYEGVTSSGIDVLNTKFNFTIEEVTEQSILNNKALSTVSPILEADHNHHNQKTKKVHFTGVDPKPINYLGNNEFKKSNDSVPTLIHVRVYPYLDKSGKALDPIDFVVGVKATLHQLPSTDIISNLAAGLRNDNKFFNFVRWTTGETKFFKDFILSIDQQKLDAKNSSSSANGWWSALRRRKASSTLRRFSKGKNILPNTTIVCTVDNLIALRESHGFDLTGGDTGLVRELMKRYFLLSFVRVDPALQRVDFLFDGYGQYETATYSTLSKSAGKDDKKFKEMMKMLGRGA